MSENQLENARAANGLLRTKLDLVTEENDALRARVEELENEMQSKEKNEEWPQFLKDTEETVFDCTTSLIWQKDHAGPMSWQEAMDYASKLELAGHSDWRLPTIEELITLIDFGKHDPASVFPNMPSKRFWSSSPYSENYAWGAYFRNGYVLDNFVYYDYCVRCVRP